MSIKSLVAAVALLFISSSAMAMTPMQIVEISNEAQYYMEQSAAAADRGDVVGACTNAKQGISLFLQLKLDDVPADALVSFFVADAAVKELISAYLELCSKY